jgi:hypothetical protein
MRSFLTFSLFLCLSTACRPDGVAVIQGVDNDEDGAVEGVDCDDDNPARYPGAIERCNLIDDNCNEQVDEGVTLTFYSDGDEDGVGTAELSIQACQRPFLYASVAGDCDDAAPTVHPGASESCNNVDDDCDGDVDEGVELALYVDQDRDGFGTGVPSGGCEVSAGLATVGGDCDDLASHRNPAAAEVCNQEDDDCDGLVDDEALDPTLWYADADNDGYGDIDSTKTGCEAPALHVANSSDCNDANPDVAPGQLESCNGIDDDCDGVTDNGATDAITWFEDSDGDGYGTSVTGTLACASPLSTGFAALDGDCNDTNPHVFPSAEELCNVIDDDCDGDIDEDASDVVKWYRDLDRDGFGDPSTKSQGCVPEADSVSTGKDCDDKNADVHPNAIEVCDGIDNDCSGATDEADPDLATYTMATWFTDDDGDGFGVTSSAETGCGVKNGVLVDGDCDDDDDDVHPDSEELCNGVDDDCNGVADDSASEGETWYRDADDDGYGDIDQPLTACVQPITGYVDNADDCWDFSADYTPKTAWTLDADADGYGDENAGAVVGCLPPDDEFYYSLNATDCDDNYFWSNPGVVDEYCTVQGGAVEGKDNNCDGVVDEGCPDLLCGTYTEDVVVSGDWEASCTVVIDGDATLTLSAGATLKMHADTDLWILSGAALVSTGTAAEPVSITSASETPAAGDWGALILYGPADLSHTEVAFGGTGSKTAVQVVTSGVTLEGLKAHDNLGAGVLLWNDPDVVLVDSEIYDNGGRGVTCGGSSKVCFDETSGSFSGNDFSGNLLPITVPLGALSRIGANTIHDNDFDLIEVNSGWVFEDTTIPVTPAPVYAGAGLLVYYGATLTLAPGSEVQFPTDMALTVGYAESPGTLVVEATSSNPAVLSALASAEGAWKGLLLSPDASANSVIEGLEVRDASVGVTFQTGQEQGVELVDSNVVRSANAGVLMQYGSRGVLTGVLALDNGGFGVDIALGGRLLGVLESSTFDGNGLGPIALPAPTLGMLGTDNVFAEDTTVYVRDELVITSQTVIHPGVPYEVQGLQVGSNANAPVLTISPGVEMLFEPYGELVVASGGTGDLRIEASDDPVVMEPLFPAVGWEGLTVNQNSGPGTLIDGLEVHGARAAYLNEGAVTVWGEAEIHHLKVVDAWYTGLSLPYVSGTVRPVIVTDSQIVDTLGDGMWANNRLRLETFEDNVITGSNGYPAVVSASYADALADNALVGNALDCVRVSGTFRHSGTWRALEVPYYVDSDIGHIDGLDMVVETGSVFRMGHGTIFDFGDSAVTMDGATFTSLRDDGLPEDSTDCAVRQAPQAGDWAAVYPGTHEDSSITNTLFEFGGEPHIASASGGYSLIWKKLHYSGMVVMDDTWGAFDGNTLRNSQSHAIGCTTGGYGHSNYRGPSSLGNNTFATNQLQPLGPDCLGSN